MKTNKYQKLLNKTECKSLTKLSEKELMDVVGGMSCRIKGKSIVCIPTVKDLKK